jgi:hypothetical protein
MNLQIWVRGTHDHPVRQVQLTLDARRAGIAHLQHGMTDRKGTAVLRHIRPAQRGTVSLRAAKTGYRTVTVKLSIKR